MERLVNPGGKSNLFKVCRNLVKWETHSKLSQVKNIPGIDAKAKGGASKKVARTERGQRTVPTGWGRRGDPGEGALKLSHKKACVRQMRCRRWGMRRGKKRGGSKGY